MMSSDLTVTQLNCMICQLFQVAKRAMYE